MQTGGLTRELGSADEVRFIAELKRRRDLVYEYLDSWHGAGDFKPADIHDALFSYVRNRGKGLRPALLMLCAGAVGGDELQALPAAAAVEIFQIWTLVHDDIIDRDLLRRGSPTVHSSYAQQGLERYSLTKTEAEHYGLSVAILAGDLQQSWGYALLCDLANRGVGAELVLKLINRMSASLTPRLLEGEMLDVQFSLSPVESLTEDDILRMLSGKTAALLEYAAWAGAMIGLADREDQNGNAERLGHFAALCGTAFQLQDDLLGLTADEATLGKPVGSDIREGKRTLLVFYALAALDEANRSKLVSVLGAQQASSSEIRSAVDIILNSGARERVETLANSYISQALNILDELPDSESKGLLRQWASFLLARRH
jgi:geranylgeranyl diphosphate synthase type I